MRSHWSIFSKREIHELENPLFNLHTVELETDTMSVQLAEVLYIEHIHVTNM